MIDKSKKQHISKYMSTRLKNFLYAKYGEFIGTESIIKKSEETNTYTFNGVRTEEIFNILYPISRSIESENYSNKEYKTPGKAGVPFRFVHYKLTPEPSEYSLKIFTHDSNIELLNRYPDEDIHVYYSMKIHIEDHINNTFLHITIITEHTEHVINLDVIGINAQKLDKWTLKEHLKN